MEKLTNGASVTFRPGLQELNKLDESTACRQLKSPRSLSGRSIHLTLVTKWSWSWSWMTYCHPLCAMSTPPPPPPPPPFWYTAISNIHGQGHVCGQRSRSRLAFKNGVQSIYLLFVSWHTDHFWLRYRKFHIWPWQFKVKIMAKVKPDGHISSLEFNRYTCFSFRGNRTICGWDIANSIYDLENSRSRSWPRSNPMVTFEFNRYFCFRFLSFRGDRTIFGWDIANSIFDLETSRSRSKRKCTKM